MEIITNLRLLRQRHCILLTELEAISGLSNQYISRAELRQIDITQRLEEQIAAAVEQIIETRKNDVLALEKELQMCRGRLLRPVEDEADE